jgi:hypothetical protein
MKTFKKYEEFIIEASSGDTFNPKRGVPTEFDHTKHPELAGEFFNLISIAYSEIGGHAKIKTPNDIFSDPDWNFWEGIDIHGSNDFDLIMFGQKTKFGIKFSGVGHDGSNQAKREYISNRGADLHKIGYYVEVSGKIADILISKYHCPIVTDPDVVTKVLGKPVDWTGKNEEDSKMPGNGWYVRTIGGHPHAKILLGRPKI